RFWILFLAGAFLVLSSYPAYACSIPVFRYALERWLADYYEGVVIHNGSLADDDPAAMLLQTGIAEFLNLKVSPIDLASPEADDLKNLLGGPVPETLPALVLWYPNSKGRAIPFWIGQFTPAKVEAMIDSPKRRQLAQRLIEGQTAVWIFVESGNADKDKSAMELISRELDEAMKKLKEMAATIAEQLQAPEVTYKFSILPVSRSDAKEQVFLEVLLKSEPDLHEYSDEPIVFPTFGRGRTLFALVGEGINVDNLREAIAFITGPCGCEIKMLNPGVDLLMAENWDAAAMQFYHEFYETAVEPLPELTGVFPDEPADAGLNAQGEVVAAAVNPGPDSRELIDDLPEPAQAPEQKVHGFGVMRTTAVSLGVILVVAAFGTFAMSHFIKGHS
ncbi:MAG: hypothetical protein JXA81_02830, partial [Sedimentisphaerales bacterium]|nr:hypothetical protein [Sedimentisphaerales bacterium]